MTDKAGKEYWNSVWEEKSFISKIDIKYYTNNLLHELFTQFLPKDDNWNICEIGCAMSPYLLYFHDYFGYKINGFDYDKESALRTLKIYENMGYKANIFERDFFSKEFCEKFDLLFSMGVFEHFSNLNESIAHTRFYLKKEGLVITIIPNMNGIMGFFQKIFNKKVYNIHFPYTKEDILNSHEKSGYETLFCDYFGIYQGGVVNLGNIKFKNLINKFLAIPGKPLYYLYKNFNLKLDSKFNSPYIIYIGKA